MNPRELFAVLLRVLGVWELVNGCTVLATFLQIAGQQGPGWSSSRYAGSLVVGVGVHFVAGGILLWFADSIATFFYPRDHLSGGDERKRSISLGERIGQIPAADRLRFWLCAAGLLTLLYFGLIAQSKVWFNLGTLHTLFLITLGCSAAAFLLRKTLPPLEGFLAAWSLAFATYSAMFALRLVP